MISRTQGGSILGVAVLSHRVDRLLLDTPDDPGLVGDADQQETTVGVGQRRNPRATVSAVCSLYTVGASGPT